MAEVKYVGRSNPCTKARITGWVFRIRIRKKLGKLERKEGRKKGRKKRKREMCGIFAYLNYKVNRERRYILQVLFNGLRRLEYRGYDSAGIAIDNSSFSSPIEPITNSKTRMPLVFRQEGNIESLVKAVYQRTRHPPSTFNYVYFFLFSSIIIHILVYQSTNFFIIILYL